MYSINFSSSGHTPLLGLGSHCFFNLMEIIPEEHHVHSDSTSTISLAYNNSIIFLLFYIVFLNPFVDTKILILQDPINFSIFFCPMVLLCNHNIYYLGINLSCSTYNRSRWRLFQKRVVHSKLDIYVFIIDIKQYTIYHHYILQIQ